MTQETDNQPVTETEDEIALMEFFRDYGPSDEIRYHSRTLRIISIDKKGHTVMFSYETKNGELSLFFVSQDLLLDIIQFNKE